MVATAPLRPAGRLGRPKAELSLTDEERSALERLARRRTSAQAAALRARIILSCATGAPNTAVAVVGQTLEQKPKDATHWSTRSMAKAMGMSQSSISLIWRAFGLQPHRAESFKLSTDPLFVEKVRDVVGLYLDPPERAVVLCVDEKSQIQALARFQPILPMLLGVPERRSHDYVPHTGPPASLRR